MKTVKIDVDVVAFHDCSDIIRDLESLLAVFQRSTRLRTLTVELHFVNFDTIRKRELELYSAGPRSIAISQGAMVGLTAKERELDFGKRVVNLLKAGKLEKWRL
jgi:hypothetical protein